MPHEIRIPITAKIPKPLHDKLIGAVNSGKFVDKTACITQALEKLLDNTGQDTQALEGIIQEREKEIQKLTVRRQKAYML